MPAVLALPLFWGAVGATAAGTGAIVAAKMQSSAGRDAANTTAAAANHAADLSSQANAEALAFQKQQAENAFQNSEAARRANYDQYADQRRRVGSVGDAFGVPGFGDVPPYVPGVDPNLTGTGGAPSVGDVLSGPSSSGGAPSVNFSAPADQLTAQLNAYFKSRGVANTETPYWVSKAAELVARGQQLNDPNYAMKRLAAADIFGGSSGATAPPPVGSVGDYLSPQYSRAPIAPALPLPSLYPAGSIGSYLR